MENKDIFKINKIIITISTFLLFNLFIINEDSSAAFLPFLFTGIASILLSITKNKVYKIIELGDNLKNNLLKFLYYFILFPLLIIIGIYGIAAVIMILKFLLPYGTEFVDILSQGLLLLLLGIILIIGLVIPYINTILYLIIRLILKHKNNY